MSAKGKGGRKPKLTAPVKKLILEQLAIGMPVKRMCAAMKISPSVYYAEVRRDKSWAEEIESAIARSLAENLRAIAKEPDWRARVWLIQNRFPEFQKKNQQLTIGTIEKAVFVLPPKQTLPELAEQSAIEVQTETKESENP